MYDEGKVTAPSSMKLARKVAIVTERRPESARPSHAPLPPRAPAVAVDYVGHGALAEQTVKDIVDAKGVQFASKPMFPTLHRFRI